MVKNPTGVNPRRVTEHPAITEKKWCLWSIETCRMFLALRAWSDYLRQHRGLKKGEPISLSTAKFGHIMGVWPRTIGNTMRKLALSKTIEHIVGRGQNHETQYWIIDDDDTVGK